MARAVPTEGDGSSQSLKPQSFLGLGGGLGIVQPSVATAAIRSVVASTSLVFGHGGEIARSRWGYFPESTRALGGGARD